MKRLTSIFLVLAMLLTLAPMNIFAADAETAVFSDMKDTDYYAQAATALEQLDILAGYPDGTFGAEKSITRAEMAAIVCRMIDKEADAEKAKGETAFDDVKSDHWASGYINVASEDKIIDGDGNGKFRPEDDVKHEEAIKMVVCALGYGNDIEVNPADWSKAYLEVADKKGISADLKGTKGKASTRGDVAVMSYNGLATDAENAKIPATPVASVNAGEYKGTQKVKLTTTTKDAEIYYTTDGTTPTVKSTKYKKEISISKTSTLKAIAVKNGVVSKGVMSVEYTIKQVSSGGGGGGGSSRPTTYSLSFATAENGSVDSSVAGSYAKNSTINLTATPAENYVFVKWESSNGGAFADANSATTTFTMPSNNVEISAVFAPAVTTYTVSFNLNYEGATGAPESQTVNIGDKASEPTAPTREGYSFVGWSTTSSGELMFDFNEDITTTITLFAKWKENTIIELSASSTKLFVDVDNDNGKNVSFYAKIKNCDDSVNSITLYDNTGNPISSLYDDGQYSINGDEFSGDNIYTCTIQIDLSNEAEYVYNVLAHTNETIISNALKIVVVPTMTSEQIIRMNTTDEFIQEEIFEAENFKNMTTAEKKELAENKLNILSEQGLIIKETITFDDENETFSFFYESGALCILPLKEWHEETNGVSRELRREKNAISQEPTNDMETNEILLFSNKDINIDDLELDAIILWSFNQAWDKESYRKPFYSSVEESWESKGVDTTVDYNATVDDYKKLSGYEIIAFSGHGIYTTYTAPNSSSSTYVSSIVLTENSNVANDEKYAEDLSLLRVGRIPVDGGTKYAILPNFWIDYYSGGKLDGSFIFAENCEFCGKDTNKEIDVTIDMSFALTHYASAESVIGFYNSVMADYSRDMMKYYFEQLIDGCTSGESLDKAKDKYGENDYFLGRELLYGPTAFPIFNGNANAILIDQQLKNSDFEDATTPIKWKTTGDVRVVSKLGELTPTSGKNMTILTTGIGSGTSSYVGATEGSTLYQTFKVPEDVTSMSFDYNVISEEPMEFVGSKYDDKFMVELTIYDNADTVNLVKESVNESQWIEVSGINFDGGDDTTYQTGWKTITYDLTGLQNQLVTLRFIAYDVGDSVYDTATLVDNIKLYNSSTHTGSGGNIHGGGGTSW